MITEGDILLFRFQLADLREGKLRPALAIKRVGNHFDDWLICMISTQTRHQLEGLEIIIDPSVPGFENTGLKKESLIRSSRLAVVQGGIFEGKTGSLPDTIFEAIREKLAVWIRGRMSNDEG